MLYIARQKRAYAVRLLQTVAFTYAAHSFLEPQLLRDAAGLLVEAYEMKPGLGGWLS